MTNTLHSPAMSNEGWSNEEWSPYALPTAGGSFPPPPPPPTLPSPAVAPAPTPGKPKRAGTGRAALVGGLVGALVAGGVAFGTVKLTQDDASSTVVPAGVAPVIGPAGAAPQNPGQLAGGSLDIRALLTKVGPSVVAIELGQADATGAVADVGAGSGVVISADGLVLTNAHVVEAGDTITVKGADGKLLPADLVGSSPQNDIALVRVRGAADMTPATLGDSDALQVGDQVVAIGNALDLGDTPTVTQGIVSAKGRVLEAGDNRLEHLIQTDAAINRGNSGGPLLNAAGEVVGINSAGIPSGQNLGFAIEINAVKPLIQQLKDGSGSVTVRPFLGVSTVDVGELETTDRDRFEITATSGAAVLTVQGGSAAADAKLQEGDVITGMDGTPVTGSAQLRELIQAKAPGDQVTLQLQRKGSPLELTAELGSRAVTGG
jgi:S1-C subfamily serine protease